MPVLTQKELFVFVYFYVSITKVFGHRCYVCGTDNSETCDGFDPANTKFIQECPANSYSCSLQSQGIIKIRSCESMKLNDCKRANKVEYCYCTKDLCNGRSIIPSDDEDDIEGSGTKTILTTPATTVKPKSNAASQLIAFPNICLSVILYSLN